jgi:hypothetical protein
MNRFVALLVALVGLPAFASAGWLACPGSAANTATTPGIVKPAPGLVNALCYTFSGTTDPPRVDARACTDRVDVVFNSDVANAGTNHDVTLYVYQMCRDTFTAGFADCEKVLPTGVDQTLTGNPVGNLDAIYNMSAGILAFDVISNAGRTAELKVICH